MSIATKEVSFLILGNILNQLPRESDPQLWRNIIGVVPSIIFSLIKYSFSLMNTVLPGILLG
jgi:hypothetical protein